MYCIKQELHTLDEHLHSPGHLVGSMLFIFQFSVLYFVYRRSVYCAHVVCVSGLSIRDGPFGFLQRLYQD